MLNSDNNRPAPIDKTINTSNNSSTTPRHQKSEFNNPTFVTGPINQTEFETYRPTLLAIQSCESQAELEAVLTSPKYLNRVNSVLLQILLSNALAYASLGRFVTAQGFAERAAVVACYLGQPDA